MRWTPLFLALIALAPAAPRAEEAPYDPRAAFAEADQNKDGSIDRQEFVERLTEVFYLGDTNKDGSLSPDELKKAVVIEEDFAAADSNHDGRVTLHEFLRVRAVLFDSADKDKDGVLSVDEVVGAYETHDQGKP